MLPQSFKETKGLRFIVWNIQSFYNKLDPVKYYIQDIAPDISLFGETWLSDAINDCIIHIPHYNIVRKDRGIGLALLKKFSHFLRVIRQKSFSWVISI